jgi:organic radical activating enzyme
MVLKIKDYEPVRVLLQKGSEIGLYKKDDKYIIYRHAARGKIKNFVGNYEFIDDNNVSHLKPIDLEYGNKILDRVEKGMKYSNIYIFYNVKSEDTKLPDERSEQEHKYTSTGIKWWRHQEAMFNYKNGNPNTVISTHISPEGACNLKCPYCSVTYRDTHTRIDLDTIKDYVTKLKTRGLKAVILTGGGEPTAYKHFNELVRWLYNEGLEVALISNGSKAYWKRIDEDVCKMFSWVRISINVFTDWENRIGLPLEKFDMNKTIIGNSMVYTVEHELSEEVMADRVGLLDKVSKVADACGSKYIRLLPNCLLEQENLIRQHKSLDNVLSQVTDKRFFHQYKILNDNYEHFAEEYQLCHASDILDYIDKKVVQKFDATTRCTGCVFTDNVNMLDDFINDKVNRFDEFKDPLTHENFI